MVSLSAVIALYIVVGAMALRFAPSRNGDEAAPY